MSDSSNKNDLRGEKLLLGDRLFWAYGHFCVWKNLKKKQSVELGLSTTNQYHNFFQPTLKAHQEAFVIELNKFLGDNLSHTNLRKLKNKKEVQLPQDKNMKVRSLLKKIEPTEKKIRALRDRYAHIFLDYDIELSIKEVTEVFKVLMEVYNIISVEIDNSVTGFDGLEREINTDLDRLIIDLQNYKPYRKKIISSESQKKITLYHVFRLVDQEYLISNKLYE